MESLQLTLEGYGVKIHLVTLSQNERVNCKSNSFDTKVILQSTQKCIQHSFLPPEY